MSWIANFFVFNRFFGVVVIRSSFFDPCQSYCKYLSCRFVSLPDESPRILEFFSKNEICCRLNGRSVKWSQRDSPFYVVSFMPDYENLLQYRCIFMHSSHLSCVLLVCLRFGLNWGSFDGIPNLTCVSCGFEAAWPLICYLVLFWVSRCLFIEITGS